jgi:hypothetical protein
MKYSFLLRAAALALVLMVLAWLSACATRPVIEAPPASLTPAMEAYTADVMRQRRGRELRRALFEALYQRDQLQLEYDSAITRTAAEAFAARQGNCLSLVIMTAALAHELRIPVVFQSVPTVDTWSRSGDLTSTAATST